MDPDIFNDNKHSETAKFMALGFVFALFANVTLFSQILEMDWIWANTILPFGWISLGLSYMSIFFHELGHTAFAWFYGYPTLPMFDFQHGGGLALSTSGQQMIILIAVWACLAYGFWYFKDYFLLKFGCAALLALNLLFAFNQGHEFFINFMGPVAVPCVASFLLFRAVFDLAPRGALERFLNAGIGLAMITSVFIEGMGLLSKQAYRLAYFEQKGAHGFGDFDKIGYQIHMLGFNGIVYIWLTITLIALILPFYAYFHYNAQR